ncbi:MAG TPA: 30S ribosome-binding factor RbfA [Acidimicrobiia bacterium]|nr:30S ribosome-binding factor RbfA [Acidimicrobiia bacterium]
MARHGSPRKYPRMARVNEVVREVIADEVEQLNDPRLGLITVTGVEVNADLRSATVYYSALEATGRRGGGVPVPATDETRAATRAALQSAAPHVQAALGRQIRLKYVPELTFVEDPSIAYGERVEEIIRGLHADDESPA